MYDICPGDKVDTYECPICGRWYRLCDEPMCEHTDAEWRAFMDHVEVMESDVIGIEEG
jgi:hypothetical protein